jgi:hypothetical protein
MCRVTGRARSNRSWSGSGSVGCRTVDTVAISLYAKGLDHQ